MSNMLTIDDEGTQIYYKDWGDGFPILFSHGWPLSCDAFEDQMLFLAQRGYRTIGLDRRGHGRSSQSWKGHSIEQYADDLHYLVSTLQINEFYLVGHSTGGSVVTRYTAKYGKLKVKKLVLIASVTPLLIQTENHKEGVNRKIFVEMRSNIIKNRSEFYLDFAKKFYGFDHFLNKTSEAMIQNFCRIAMQGSIQAHLECIDAFSETDLTYDLEQIEIPTLVLYGTKDTIVPPTICSQKSLLLLKNSFEKVITDAPHGLCSTHKNEVNSSLLEFFNAEQ